MMASQESGDHAIKEELQAEEKLPGGEGDENSGTELEALPVIDLEEKITVMNLDDRNQETTEELKAIELETSRYKLRMDNFYQATFDACQLKIFLTTGLQIRMDLLPEGQSLPQEVWNANWNALQEAARGGWPEIVKRVNDQTREITAIKEATLGIRRRIEELDKASGDLLRDKRDRLHENFPKLEEMVMKAEKNWFEIEKLKLLEGVPHLEAEGVTGAQSLERSVEAGPARQKAFEQEYESILSLLGDEVSFEGLKSLMTRVKFAQDVQAVSGLKALMARLKGVTAMEAENLLEKLDELQLENIRSILRLHHFFQGILDALRVKDIQKYESHIVEVDVKEKDLQEEKWIAYFQGLETAARNGPEEIEKRVKQLHSELGAIKEATSGVRGRAEQLDKAAGTELTGKRQKVKERLLQHEKNVEDAEKYFKSMQFELFKPITQAEQNVVLIQAEISVILEAKIETRQQLNLLEAAIADIS